MFYNRSNEAGAMLKDGDFDWEEIFAGGCRWFHSGGIFSALSETTPDLIINAMKAAKKAGAIVSFDLNYRAKLWNLQVACPTINIRPAAADVCRRREALRRLRK